MRKQNNTICRNIFRLFRLALYRSAQRLNRRKQQVMAIAPGTAKTKLFLSIFKNIYGISCVLVYIDLGSQLKHHTIVATEWSRTNRRCSRERERVVPSTLPYSLLSFRPLFNNGRDGARPSRFENRRFSRNLEMLSLHLFRVADRSTLS